MDSGYGGFNCIHLDLSVNKMSQAIPVVNGNIVFLLLACVFPVVQLMVNHIFQGRLGDSVG